jgi:hypothetical protein
MAQRGRWLVLGVVASAGLLAGSPATKGDEKKDKTWPDKAAVERTRDTVKMLDDLYKLSVVHITTTYVKARERTPAATAAKRIFRDMAAKGRHTVRLIDATGSPSNKDNVAKSPFEKRALAKLKAGKTYYEEVGKARGKPVLRAATPVPVVMKACLNCHPGLKEGELIGALTYEVPVK